MSDRLFSLAQEIEQIRQQFQQGLSETKSYDDSPHNNRLLALEQSLSVMEPDSHANAYGYGGMLDGGRNRATNRMSVREDDMFDSYGESGYRMPDNRRRGMSSPEYGWESEDSMQDNRRRRMPSSDYIQDSRDDIQDSRDDIRMSRNRARKNASDYIQDSRDDIQDSRDDIQSARDDIRTSRNRDRKNAYDTSQNSRGDRRNHKRS